MAGALRKALRHGACCTRPDGVVIFLPALSRTSCRPRLHRLIERRSLVGAQGRKHTMREVVRGSLLQGDLLRAVHRLGCLAVFASLGIALVGGSQPAMAQSLGKAGEAGPPVSAL